MNPGTERAERKQAESQQAMAERLLHQLRNRGALEERLDELKRFEDRHSPSRLTFMIVVNGVLFLLGLFQIVNVSNAAESAGENFAPIFAGGIIIAIAAYTNLVAFYLDRRYGRSESLLIKTLLGIEHELHND